MRLRPGKRINPQHFAKLYGEGHVVSFPDAGYNPRIYGIIREQCRRGDWTHYRGDSTGREIRPPRWGYTGMTGPVLKFDYYIFSNPDDAMMFKLHI